MIARAALLLVLSATQAVAQPDTVVRQVDRPLHGGIATLRRELTIGVATGAEHDMLGAIGDVAVGPTGVIYVWDRSVPAIRMYDPNGKYVKTIGAKGSGPGEYRSGAAIAIARNGNLLMWDPGNARINVYTASGNVVTSWPTMGAGGSSAGQGLLVVDTAGIAYIQTVIVTPRQDGSADTRTARIRFSPTGQLLDTLFGPQMPEGKYLTATSGKGQFSTLAVPFAAGYVTQLSPYGYFLTGWTGRIALDIHEKGKPLTSIRRNMVLRPVSAHERDSARAAMTAEMRTMDPRWSWNGPAIPANRPAYRSPFVGADGRIWIQLEEGPRVPGDTAKVKRGDIMTIQTRDGRTGPSIPWSCPESGWTLYDVYEPRGVYVGQVRIPARVDPIVVRGDYIWGVTCDRDDVPSVGRYRVVWP
jgi:hypothetical protein